MRKQRIPAHLRKRVRTSSPLRCSYCHSPEVLLGVRLEVDHIIPEGASGATEFANLCLICSRCNSHKYKRTHARDPLTGRRVRLFHPKRQKWDAHFAWSEDGTHIIGLTPCGSATVAALNMNDVLIVQLRQMWVEDGRHPLQTGE